MLTLREDQLDVLEQVRAHLRRGEKRLLVQMPTGSGKTVLGSHMLGSIQQKGKRAWFVVHRRELVRQTDKTLGVGAGVHAGVISPHEKHQPDRPIQICMIGSLARRFDRMRMPWAIFWDEAHHVAASTWSKIFDKFPNIVHIGLTATPQRLDGKGLHPYFDHLITGPSVQYLIEHGHLSNYKIFAPSLPNMQGVHLLGGDFNRREVADVMGNSTVMGDVITHYDKHCLGKRMVVFAWSISASKAIAARFREHGVRAAHLDGTTPASVRYEAMEAFRRGDTRVLCNVDLFSEGLDVPAIEAVATLRPTNSLSMHLQQLGRGLRSAEGKEFATILDHAGNSLRHGLPDDEREWSLADRERRNKSDAAPVKRCDKCLAVYRAHLRTCPECGHSTPVQERQIEEREGELAEMNEARRKQLETRREQGMCKSLEELIELGTKRGYKAPDRWAQHIWNARLARGVAQQARQEMGL